MDSIEPEVVVLLSGGLDSTICLASYIDQGIPTSTVHIDYGQAAAKQEFKASKEIAHFYSVPYMKLKWSGGTSKNIGLIQGRNLFLLAAALMEAPKTATTVAIAIHKGTDYVDCSKLFVDKLSEIYYLYRNNTVELSTPFLEWSKDEIWKYGEKLNIPIDLTWSCENGSSNPCDQCLSCKDRKILSGHKK